MAGRGELATRGHRDSFLSCRPRTARRQACSRTTKPAAKERFTRFRCPTQPNPVVNEYSASGAHDYRKLADRADVLTFDSPRLEARYGSHRTNPGAHLRLVRLSRLDLWVRLLDVAPDGTAFNLMSPGLDVQRASYRDLQTRPPVAHSKDDLRNRPEQPDHQQHVPERSPYPRADFRQLLSEFLAQPAKRQIRSDFYGY